MSSSSAGTPAVICRGRRACPSAAGAGGRDGQSGPGQCPVSAAYSRLARPRVSSAAGSSEVIPVSAASTPRPTIFTPLFGVHRSDPGCRQRCASPAACATDSAAAASATICAARPGSIGPAASRSSSESPAAHSITM